jgi:hypothetical protein
VVTQAGCRMQWSPSRLSRFKRLHAFRIANHGCNFGCQSDARMIDVDERRGLSIEASIVSSPLVFVNVPLYAGGSSLSTGISGETARWLATASPVHCTSRKGGV